MFSAPNTHTHLCICILGAHLSKDLDHFLLGGPLQLGFPDCGPLQCLHLCPPSVNPGAGCGVAIRSGSGSSVVRFLRGVLPAGGPWAGVSGLPPAGAGAKVCHVQQPKDLHGRKVRKYRFSPLLTCVYVS